MAASKGVAGVDVSSAADVEGGSVSLPGVESDVYQCSSRCRNAVVPASPSHPTG
ncbi:hypothetical protein Taro_012166, partial [Colocasia esculenta]|nr:hypothetical protein [Colocasia esculenta]